MHNNSTSQYWDNFYKSNYISDTSSFYKFVSNQVASDSVVIDIGCGTARDTIAFSSRTEKVIGVDASSIVIERNQMNYNQLYPNINFINLDITDSEQLDELIGSVKASHQKIYIYSRFFLHAVSDNAEDILLSILGKHLDYNDLIFLEFRTKEDEGLYKNYDNHFRRYVDTDEFDVKLKKYSFDIKFFVKSRGLSIYNNEDPFLARYTIKKEV